MIKLTVFFLSLLFVMPTFSKSQSIAKQNLSDDSATIKFLDEENGYYNTPYDTSQDSAMLNLSYHVNPMVSFSSLNKTTSLMSIEGDFIKRYDQTWWKFHLSATTGENEIVNEGSELETSSILTFGVGPQYRFFLFQNFFQNPQIFETVSTLLTYSNITDTAVVNTLTGFGLKADFGIHYRKSQRTHYGIILSYNLLPAKDSTEIMKTLTWISLGFEFGIYF